MHGHKKKAVAYRWFAFGQRDGLDVLHNLGQSLSEMLGLDVHNGASILVFPVESSSNVEDLGRQLDPYIQSRTYEAIKSIRLFFRRFCQFVVVDVACSS